ncbi:ABC transporter ATP-binding protein [candidate division WOR-3 bacterium]|nr:ABC transporter ATP-binding protein [candidate division WOR-3 bacterium]
MRRDKSNEGIRSFKTILPYLKGHWAKIIGGFIFLAIVDIGQVLLIKFLADAINSLSPDVSLGYVAVNVGIYLVIGLLIAVGRYFWRRWLSGTGVRVITDLRLNLFDHLQSLSFSFYDKRQVGDLMAHSTEDVEHIRRSITFGPIIVVDIVFQGVAAIVGMIFLEFPVTAKLTLFTLIPLIVILVFVGRFSRVLRSRWRAVREAFSSMMARVTENLSGIRVVKAYVQEDGETREFKSVSRDYVDKNIDLFKIWGIMFPLVGFLASISMFLILLLGGREVILGDLTIGSFIALPQYINVILWPMMAIGWLMNMLQAGAAAMGRLNRLFETKPEIKDTGKTLNLASIEGKISFKKLTFYYPEMPHPALKNVSFKLYPGKILGIIGTLGSGKSTLVNLIQRLYEAPQGTITVDGHDIRTIPLEVLRSSIGMVPQDTFLFSQTVKENIAFGLKREYTTGEVEEAARIAGIHDEITEFPQAYDTVLGERGVTVSGGQKQRLTIARAVLTEPKILILDDALSAVDADTEIEILTALKGIMRERAVIIISARPRSLAFADEILVMDEGRIAERGTHEELIKKDGLYALFARLQGVK